jgi:hypothetical protein
MKSFHCLTFTKDHMSRKSCQKALCLEKYIERCFEWNCFIILRNFQYALWIFFFLFCVYKNKCIMLIKNAPGVVVLKAFFLSNTTFIFVWSCVCLNVLQTVSQLYKLHIVHLHWLWFLSLDSIIIGFYSVAIKHFIFC